MQVEARGSLEQELQLQVAEIASLRELVGKRPSTQPFLECSSVWRCASEAAAQGSWAESAVPCCAERRAEGGAG